MSQKEQKKDTKNDLCECGCIEYHEYGVGLHHNPKIIAKEGTKECLHCHRPKKE